MKKNIMTLKTFPVIQKSIKIPKIINMFLHFAEISAKKF
jgi:hypothetical protein